MSVQHLDQPTRPGPTPPGPTSTAGDAAQVVAMRPLPLVLVAAVLGGLLGVGAAAITGATTADPPPLEQPVDARGASSR